MKPTQTDRSIASSLKLFRITAGAFIFSVITIGALAFSTAIKDGSRYFSDSIPAFALSLLIIPAIILAICAILVFRGHEISATESVTTRIASLFTAAAATVPFIYYIYKRITPVEADEISESSSDFLFLLLAVTSVAVALFALSHIFNAGRTLPLILGYGQVLFGITIVAIFYLDYTVELNSPAKLLLQFAAVSIMISTTADLRILIGRSSTPLFITAKLVSASLSLLYFVAFALEIYPNIDKYNHLYAILAPLFLFYGIVSATKVFSFKLTPQIVTEAHEEESDSLLDTKPQTEDELSSEHTDLQE